MEYRSINPVADFSLLKDEIQVVEASGTDWLPVDVLDGPLCPQYHYRTGSGRIDSQVTKIPLDVHLMIADPD